MRRIALLGLLLTSAFVMIVVPTMFHNTRSAPERRAAPEAVPAPAPSAHREAVFKQQLVLQDMAATEQLSRAQTAADMRKHLVKGPCTMPELRQLMKQHPEMRLLEWTDGTVTHTATSDGFASPSAAAGYMEAGRAAAKQGKAYTSPLFEDQGKSFFVMAQAAPESGKGEMVSIISTDVVKAVERHQRRNLRIVPYPAEGRYRVESVVPNSTQETTVRTGEDNGDASHYAVDEVVVKFRAPLTDKQLLALRRELQLTVVKHTRQTYVFRSKKHKTEELIAYFKSKWNPVFVEPHYLYLTNELPAAPTAAGAGTGGTIVPNDTLYSEYQWNLPKIDTESGWNVTKGSDDIVVAVIDTGVQSDHPDLKGRLVQGVNIVDPSSPPEDDVGHGTHVAGIISASVNNGEGVAGMTWYTKIMPVKALDSSGAGSTYSVAEGILWATDHGADVINMSLGNYATAEFLHDALKYAYDHGVVLVAASGNDNTDRPGFPAAYEEVLAVAATDPDNSRAEYSNYGDYIDIAAPGTSIPSTYPGSRYAALSGTSMASPHVSALASLVRAANPKLTNAEVMDVIRKTAVDLGAQGQDKEFGYGQIDVVAALQAVRGNAAPQEPVASASPEATTEAGVADEASMDASLQLFLEQIRREIERLSSGG